MAKLHAARCPTCGANLSVPPNAPFVTCRYCGNHITVQHRKAPVTQMQGVPSTTLYIDPEEARKAGQRAGCMVMGIIFATVLLPVLIGVVPWAYGRLKGAIRPFPAVCGMNETLELSGNWEGSGPIIKSAGHNCKVRISGSRIKGTTLLTTTSSNVEITLVDSTVETTDVAIAADANLHVTLENSTVKSTGDAAIKTGYNLKLSATASKIIGKKTALDTKANADLKLKKASEITSEGVAIKTESNLALEAEGGKIDGAEAAIEGTSGAKVTATGTTFSSKDKAIALTSGFVLGLSDGSVIGGGESAIECENCELTLSGAKVQGAAMAIEGKNNMRLKALKKSSIVATAGDALVLAANGQLTINDASIEGARWAIKSTDNTKIKLGTGAKVVGRRGGVLADSNLELETNGATIDGNAGSGIEGAYNAKIVLQHGTVKGTPALSFRSRPNLLTIDGAQITGEQKMPAR